MAEIRLKIAKEVHEKFRLESLELLKKYSGKLPAIEMLAIGSYMVGQLVALQDQRIYTGPIVMQVVSDNIEQGNKDVITNLLGQVKGSG